MTVREQKANALTIYLAILKHRHIVSARIIVKVAVCICILGLLVAWLALFRPDSGPNVVVYTALDQDFSEPIFQEFTLQTGIRVLGKFDTESTKTVGLTQAIFAERTQPRCDVFWNNEIVNTLRLDQAGLLAAYHSAGASAFPQQYRSASNTWYGFAARARVLIVNTELVAVEDRPSSIFDLVDPAWKDKVGIAKPLAGTTASHAACLFAAWGKDQAEDFFRRLRGNARVMSGNKQVARSVATGELAFGLTDTDDAIIELEQGWPIAIIYPDQGDEQIGTMFIPNTVSIIKGSRHTEAAQQLIDFLLSPKVEGMLALGPSAQIPLNPAVKELPRVETPRTVRAMKVDFEAAAKQWSTTAEFLRQEFTAAN